ncbi:MAG TPA: DUF2231 domain-containing protein [Actinophytocola sp.]|jgi:uncharacterized membrane protein|uniref:DUF2231 domain-containing protein n=1 Tax=Actinophytocola sp. TaxID=1872138 RepID=UPI002F92C2AE
MKPRDMLRRAETLRSVDKPAGALAGVTDRVLRAVKIRELLRGAWLGHPLHPVLVTVPLGAWTGATMLDCTGQRVAARRLVALGLAMVPPSVAAGLADYTDLDPAQRRVGLLHAAANTVATSLLAASYGCRRTNRYAAGVLLTLLGVGVASAGGALGGHLAYAQGSGVRRFEEPPFIRRPEPAAIS